MIGSPNVSLGLLIVVVVVGLLSQWRGLMRLGKGNRDRSWWLMAAGTVLATGSILVLVGGFGKLLVSTNPTDVTTLYLAGGGVVLGAVISAVGFVIHGRRTTTESAAASPANVSRP